MATELPNPTRVDRVYEFGPFRLNVGERLLLRGGEPVALTPKVLDVLTLLVENHGHLVEKEKLIETVWPDSFVDENNLNRSISTLRKVLGEPRYIETVPKRGYRFIAPVTEAQAGEGFVLAKLTAAHIVTEEEEEISF